MSLFIFLVIGFVVGLAARAIMPGTQSMGIIGTTALGVVGSFLGGLISALVYTRQDWLELHPSGLLFSLLGALAVLGMVGVARGGRGLRV